MNVLVLCDDYWHPARTPRAGLAPLNGAGYAFDFIEHAADWSAARMAAYPVVLLTKSNNVSAADKTLWMTDDVQQAFVDYVRRRRAARRAFGYSRVPGDACAAPSIGRRLRTIPSSARSPSSRWQATLTAGVEAFTVQDEHYFMDMDDAGVDLFLTASSQHGVQPAGWALPRRRRRGCAHPRP